ncbi:MAG: phosphoribosylaminoimidazolesuccinocarboxamide synthase [Nitrososphaerales archaeon]
MAAPSSNLRFIKSGKVKDVYQYGEDRLMFVFSDRVSAFDVVLPTPIPRKGEVLCRFSEFWFRVLPYPNHMLEIIHPNKMITKKLDMIPLECVVRGYNYGSYYERIKKGLIRVDKDLKLAEELPEPVFDPTTKSETKDLPITKVDAVAQGLLTAEEYNQLEENSIKLYTEMKKQAERAGFIIADVKFEFGRDKEGKIILADSLGPDEFRLWLKSEYKVGEEQKSYDKQIVRDWLIKVSFRDKLEEARKAGLQPPTPPNLPPDLVEETLRRYITAYELISGRRL